MATRTLPPPAVRRPRQETEWTIRAAAINERRPRPLRRIPGPRQELPKPPDGPELRYVAALRRLWRKSQAVIALGLRPWFEAASRANPGATRTDDFKGDDADWRALLEWVDRMAETEDAETIIRGLQLARAMPTPALATVETMEFQVDWLRVAIGELIEREVPEITANTAVSINGHTYEQMRRVLRIDLRKDVPGIRPLIDRWRTANVNLIESGIMAPFEEVHLRPSLLTDVSRMVEDAHAKGLRVEVLRDQLQDRFGVSMARADLIARDQVLKLNGQITGHRQQQAGITEYVWSASNDDRVREIHSDLHGTTHKWDDPPVVSPDGRREHPGGDYQCRCVAVPIPPDWLRMEGDEKLPESTWDRAREHARKITETERQTTMETIEDPSIPDEPVYVGRIPL